MASEAASVAEAIRRAKEVCLCQQLSVLFVSSIMFVLCTFCVQLANKMTAGSGGAMTFEDTSRKRAPDPDDIVSPAAKKLMEIRKFFCEW